MMNHLSKRQKDILGYIKMHTGTKGYSPTYREIAKAVGLSSISSVQHQLNALEAYGLIKHTPYISRSIVLVNRDNK